MIPWRGIHNLSQHVVVSIDQMIACQIVQYEVTRIDDSLPWVDSLG